LPLRLQYAIGIVIGALLVIALWQTQAYPAVFAIGLLAFIATWAFYIPRQWAKGEFFKKKRVPDPEPAPQLSPPAHQEYVSPPPVVIPEIRRDLETRLKYAIIEHNYNFPSPELFERILDIGEGIFKKPPRYVYQVLHESAYWQANRFDWASALRLPSA
jgi:hypothetical protein